MRARARTLLAVLLSAALLSGCGSGGGSEAPGDSQDSQDAAAASTPSQTPPSEATAPPEEAPATTGTPEVLRFTGKTVDGKDFDGATLAGKPTVLWFWAPWCPKCRAQAAETAKVAADFSGRANVVGVAGLDRNDSMRDFVAQTRSGTFPHVSDEAGEVWKRFKVTQQSVYVILDKDGKETYSGVLPGGKGLAEKVGKLVG
ncbi:redoxin domain-containing protein [Streptomyces sp. HNM0663]|uniref:Redoxin domain-containing protein n=1 Tax=Streptomyces chengmaiensis TaxID=3040919 RepID=A0ABT6HRI6_9ACTN|nr:redoxin domain-containing protein [Streptomyces chengmaiensis]MDH2390917.1 redoxin domain-containing protein [Streptomyces chengmaiensis]